MKDLQIGEQSANGQITIVDEDRLCYLVRSVSKGSVGLRTISKMLLGEFAKYRRTHPNCTPNEARDALKGRTEIDRFEYGYCYTLLPMADMVLGKEKEGNKVSLTFSHLEVTPLQVIYYGAPGTGKSHAIKEQTEGKSVIRTTFHPDSDYSTFVGAYKPTTVDDPVMTVIGTNAVPVMNPGGTPRTEKKIVYEFVPQAFLQAYVKAWLSYAEAKDGECVKEQYLVIEEINRGNCAQIFGDLFQLLDRNDDGYSEYPINADKDMEKYLAEAFKGIAIPNEDKLSEMFKDPDIAQKIGSGKVLVLPSNLHIWATMNTSDQSLFPIDSAFKRRWDWKYIPISEGIDKQTNMPLGWKLLVNGKHYDWWAFLQAIDMRIGDLTKSQDKKLGYFFCKAKDEVIDAETLVGKVLFFLWNEVLKDFQEDQPFLSDGNGGNMKFDDFYAVDAKGLTVVQEDKVERLLANLEVKPLTDETFDNSDEEKSDGRDYTKYSINGGGAYGKRTLAVELVKRYVQEHPTLTAQEIINRWKSVGDAMKRVQHFMETEGQYQARRTRSTDKNDRAVPVQCADATIYVSTLGWGGTDSIDELRRAIKAYFPTWGIEIQEVKDNA